MKKDYNLQDPKTKEDKVYWYINQTIEYLDSLYGKIPTKEWNGLMASLCVLRNTFKEKFPPKQPTLWDTKTPKEIFELAGTLIQGYMANEVGWCCDCDQGQQEIEPPNHDWRD